MESNGVLLYDQVYIYGVERKSCWIGLYLIDGDNQVCRLGLDRRRFNQLVFYKWRITRGYMLTIEYVDLDLDLDLLGGE